MPSSFLPEQTNLKNFLIGDKQYKVPPYQRDYSWDNKENHEWEFLWDDIISDAHSHFTGFLVLKKNISEGQEVFDVIDGQQRLATASIIIVAALRILDSLVQTLKGKKKQNEMNRLAELKRDYIGKTDTITMTTYSKLSLNNNNYDTFKKICSLENLEIRPKDSYSNKNLKQALIFFEKKIKAHLGETYSGEDIARFISDKVTNKLFFIKLEVDDTANAYTLFETLNGRGVQLAQSDLLKNYLLSLSQNNSEHLKEAINLWNKLINNVKDKDITSIVRIDWHRSHSIINEREIFSKVSSEIRTETSSFPYLRHLVETGKLYSDIVNYRDVSWEEQGYNALLPSLEAIEVLKLRTVFPLLLNAYDKFSPKDFTKFCQWLEILSFRYNTIAGKDAKVQERIYNNLALQVATGAITKPKQMIPLLKKIYVDDSDFEKAFRTKVITNPRICRYILSKLDESDADISKITLEHILDRNNPELFPQITNPQEVTWRLGNMTLLNRNTNKGLSGKNYLEKVKVYKKVPGSSHFTMKTIFTFKEWTEQAIDTRQKKLAEKAKKIWAIKELKK